MKKLWLALGLMGAQAALQGCLQDSQGGPSGNNLPPVQEEAKMEEAFPGRTGVKGTGFYQGQFIEYETIDGENVFQGDILIPSGDISSTPPSLEKETGAGRTAAARKWTNMVVYYNIETGMTGTDRVTTALDHWSNKFTFVLRTNQSAYITFRNGSGGCSSPVGRQGSQQFINLGAGCSGGNAIHELGHSLGLYHEMSRSSRDNDVTVNWNNIESGKSFNFNTYTADGTDGFDWLPFDFNSVMMYSSTAFGKVVGGVTQTTISAKDGRAWVAQRNGLSAGDIRTVEAMYPSQSPTWTGAVARFGNNLDVVVARSDGSIWTAAWDQNVSNGAWRGWWNVAGGVTSAGGPVSMVARYGSQLDVFTLGTDNRVYTAAWNQNVANGAWQGWWVVGGLTVWPGAQVVATARASDKLDIFTVGGDGIVYTAAWDQNVSNGAWRGWWPILGGVAVSGGQVSAVSTGSGRLDVYTVGQDGNVWQAYWNGATSPNWQGWFNIGNPGVGLMDVSVISRSATKYDVFATGLDRNIYHRSYNGSWGAWTNVLNGVAAAGSKIAIASRNSTQLDIFVIGTDNRVYTAAKADGGSWGGWWAVSNITVRPGSQLTAVSRGLNKLDVFCTGSDGGTWTAAWDAAVAGGWRGWWRLP
jgi:astacin (peptidase family M12A)